MRSIVMCVAVAAVSALVLVACVGADPGGADPSGADVGMEISAVDSAASGVPAELSAALSGIRISDGGAQPQAFCTKANDCFRGGGGDPAQADRYCVSECGRPASCTLVILITPSGTIYSGVCKLITADP